MGNTQPLFSTSTARLQQRQGLLQQLVDLGRTPQEVVPQAPGAERLRVLSQRLRGLRSSLHQLRGQRGNALGDFGPLASRQPVAHLWDRLDHGCDSLILERDELRRRLGPHRQAWGLEPQHADARAFSIAVLERLLV